MKGLISMKKVINFLRKVRKRIAKYLSTNRLFLIYVFIALFQTITVRHFTLGNTFAFEPFICDLALIIIIGSFAYFLKPRKQFTYFFIWLCISGSSKTTVYKLLLIRFIMYSILHLRRLVY